MTNPYGEATSWQESQARLRRQYFRPDPSMERLAALRTTDPDRYDRVPATSKLALGTYLASKEAAETGEPPATSKTFPNYNDAA